MRGVVRDAVCALRGEISRICAVTMLSQSVSLDRLGDRRERSLSACRSSSVINKPGPFVVILYFQEKIVTADLRFTTIFHHCNLKFQNYLKDTVSNIKMNLLKI